jgi:hypothetical protein
VRSHLPQATGPDFRLDLAVEIPVAALGQEGRDGLPAVVDPDTVLPMAALTCASACEAFFPQSPAARLLPDPDASGVYARRVPIAGIRETVAIDRMVGCEVVAEDVATALPTASELPCFPRAAPRAETPFLEPRPSRGDRRGKGRRR